METTTIINYHEQRDFSQKLNATFAFLRQNFKPLLKSLIYIAGPLALLTGISYGYYQTSISSAMKNAAYGSGFERMGLSLFAMMGSMMLAFTMLICVVYSYMMIYEEKKNIQIEVSEVWAKAKQNYGKVFFSIIGFAVITVIGYVFFIIPGIYIQIALSLAGIIMIFENTGFSDSLSRSFSLIKGKWWSTFGLILIAGLVQGVMSMVFAVPMYIVSFINMFHMLSGEATEPSPTLNLILFITSAFYFFAAFLFSAISLVAIAFQYFNLRERKEGTGLLSEIQEIGVEK